MGVYNSNKIRLSRQNLLGRELKARDLTPLEEISGYQESSDDQFSREHSGGTTQARSTFGLTPNSPPSMKHQIRPPPFLTLPTELILEILQYCLMFSYGRGASKIPPPFFVCARWRAIAIGSPSLWNKIDLSWVPELVGIFLDRSETCLLEVSFSNEKMERWSEKEDSRLSVIGRLLAQNASRISRLRISWVTSYYSLSGFLSRYILQSEFSSLISLEIKDCSEDVFSVALNTPRLQRFDFFGHPINIPKVTPDNVVTFTYDWCNLSTQRILELLSQFPNLTHLKIINDTPLDLSPEVNHPVITLPALHSLSLDELTVSSAISLFARLEMPSLMEVDLGIVKESSENEICETFLGPYLAESDTLFVVKMDTIIHYLAKSESGFCIRVEHRHEEEHLLQASLTQLASYRNKISNLSLAGLTLPPVSDIVQILGAWSRLTHLDVLMHHADFERLLTALEQETPLLCPLLRNLEYACIGLPESRMGQFRDFRASRGCPIQLTDQMSALLED
ncbi:hypothetical protein SISNIDRAFT_487075 [Sistotremastrum niveocremeum HHB9708]|uniref:Uncharacterized protein n=1 Tax=Sistotremastrum niveocremeum HHB9708 TaxID=1314777 RepID=A0A164SSE4_9AGAM|nr:hypothetical protein SISNIDRAFT_487075 [Sistotremastrum niveocremeum HHB9708]